MRYDFTVRVLVTFHESVAVLSVSIIFGETLNEFIVGPDTVVFLFFTTR